MTRIFEQLEDDWRELRAHIPHPHRDHQYDHPETTQEDVMPLAIIQSIEDEAHQLGADVSDVWHQILAKHLTLANIAAHVAQGVADVQANPLAGVVEKFALGAGGEAFVEKLVADAAAFLNSAQPVDAAPAPEPADPTAP